MADGNNVIQMFGASPRHSERSYDGSELRQVLAALSAGLERPGGDGDLPGIFEEQVQRLLSMRSVRLRELPARYQARLVTPTRTADSIVVGVPTTEAGQAILEASFEPGRRLSNLDLEMLTAVAQLGGLVLEAVRVRTHRPATGDGAAPMIGSTLVMQALRDRIERVAQTDFTLLIEGESGTGRSWSHGRSTS